MTASYDVHSVEFERSQPVGNKWYEYIDSDEEGVMFIQAHTFGIRVIYTVGPTNLIPWHRVIRVVEDSDEN